MACLQTKPQLYSKWCSKTLRDKFNVNCKVLTINKTMSFTINSSSDERRNLKEAEQKIRLLKILLDQDLQAADFKWSLFVAACFTYKHDSCLKPFPPMFIKNESKDIEALREAVEIIPPLALILNRLDDPNIYETHKATIDLLYWVLIGLRDPFIKSVKKESYESIISKVPSELTAAKPNLIFKVVSPNQSAKEDRWEATTKGHSTFFAYHGSRLENYHSILQYGIQQHMSKSGIFGKGIYLSSELEVSLRWSPGGYGWGGSMIGSELSCVAMCELVSHPDVKKGDAETSGNALEVAVGKKVPSKYYLALNSDLVRVRYLFVYCKDLCIIRRPEMNGVVGWLTRNKCLTVLIGYVVLLVSVGLSHNKNVEKYYKLLIQKIGLDWPSN